MKLREKSALVVIKVARKLFYNTPVQQWHLTSLIYDTVFHAGYSDRELNTNYFGAMLTFPGRDLTITPGLVGGFYEKHELNLFQKICGMSKRVVDVGGNIGLYTVVAGNAGCDVEVFEPVPENCEYLKKNIAQNGLTKKVKVIQKAVSSKKGSADIFLSQQNIGTHSLSAQSADSATSIKVDVVTLDEYIDYAKSKVDLLKIDVEGYDGYVLEGAKNLLKTCHPTLFIELVPRRLKASNYNPAEFVGLIYANYSSVFIVDEIDGHLERITKNKLTGFAAANKDANLIAVDSDTHKAVLTNAARKNA